MFKVGDLVRLPRGGIYGSKYVDKDAVYLGDCPRYTPDQGVCNIKFIDKTVYEDMPYPCYRKNLVLAVIKGDDDEDCI